VATAAARERKMAAPREREAQADPVGAPPVGVHAGDDGHGGAERSDLGEREIHKDDAAFDYMYAEIGVNSRKNKAPLQKREARIPASRFHSFEPASSCFLHFQRERSNQVNGIKSLLELGNVVVKQLEIVGDPYFRSQDPTASRGKPAVRSCSMPSVGGEK